MPVDEKYEAICRKLGFRPHELEFEPAGTEDDTRPNPFSVLELEELLYIMRNGYLDPPEKRRKRDALS